MDTVKKYVLIGLSIVLCVVLSYLFYIKKERDNALISLDLANKNIEMLGTYIEKTNQQLKTIQQIDKDYQDKIQHAKVENERLLNDLDTANKRLYVKVKCPVMPTNTTTTSRTDDSTRAELNRETSKRIIRITQDGDNAIMQLNQLQKYVNEVCLKK